MSRKSSRVRVVIAALLVVFFLILGVIGFFGLTAWKPLESYSASGSFQPVQPILNDAEYGELIDSHARPYIVRADANDGSTGKVLIYGSTHTNDPNDPSLDDIRKQFRSFDPTIVLCEGRMTGLLFPQLMDPVATFGESGLVRALAYENDCDVFTWEPSPRIVVQGLIDQGFDREQVALRLILGPYFSNLRFGKPDDPDAVAAEAIRKKQDWPRIGDVFGDVGELDQAWANRFPDGPDWRDVSDEFGLPGFLGEMDANLVRDEHLFQVVMELVSDGERVFVIAGSSHAVKMDAAVVASVAALGEGDE